MGITRKSKFGFPPPPNRGSTQTTRLVPLSQGINTEVAWPLKPPGSAESLSNYLPLDGVITPRSRLSSLNTIRTLNAITGISPVFINNGIGWLWLSNSTTHAFLTSNGSISRASFVSAWGKGTAPTVSANRWNYAQGYSANVNDNMLIAADGLSNNSLVCLYLTGGSSGNPVYSYLTEAPQAKSVTAFDNYIVAFSLTGGLFTRVQWCARGNPSNWTGEGSGFEDILAMRGAGTAIMGTREQRMLLFTNLEIWYGVGAAYPAQFQFLPLDTNVGCSHAATIQDTDAGVMFLGSDGALRVIPAGGGASQIVPGAPRKALQNLLALSAGDSWAAYNSKTKLYHLFLNDSTTANAHRGFVYNVVTGEWGQMDYNTPTPFCGVELANSLYPNVERLFFGNSTGTVYSFNSKLSLENGSGVTSTWRSSVIAPDLAGNYKQITQVDIDYTATSKSTLTLKISQDGGNNYESVGRVVALAAAPVSGRATSQMYLGDAFPTLEITSQSTGYELHRLDVTMQIGGRKSG